MVPVEDSEEEVVGNPAVEFVDDDCFLTAVSLPPDSLAVPWLGEEVCVGVLVDGAASFASAGRSPVDDDFRLNRAVSPGCQGCACGCDAWPVLEGHRGVLLEELQLRASALQGVECGLEVRPEYGYRK